jgi:hypothetical protein
MPGGAAHPSGLGSSKRRKERVRRPKMVFISSAKFGPECHVSLKAKRNLPILRFEKPLAMEESRTTVIPLAEERQHHIGCGVSRPLNQPFSASVSALLMQLRLLVPRTSDKKTKPDTKAGSDSPPQ